MTCSAYFVLLPLFLLLLNYEAVGCNETCDSDKVVYGENGIIDELASCTLARSFDLDLTPHGDHTKPTGRPLSEQGLSNRTAILHARLSGLWTSRRPDFIETAWKCLGERGEQIVAESVLEVSGLSLEVVEKLDISLHKGQKQLQQQHKLATHRPCKTFDLPIWMCRDQKSIYRMTSTWANRAYLRLKLTQRKGQVKPKLADLSMMFTCPERFRQKISYSPSVAYVLTRHLHSNQLSETQPTLTISQKASKTDRTRRQTNSRLGDNNNNNNHWDSHWSSLQSARLPTVPPHHNSVRLIQRYALEALRSTLTDCIQLIDSDLTLVAGHSSFVKTQFNHPSFEQQNDSSTTMENTETNSTSDSSSAQTPPPPPADSNHLIVGECSNRFWVKNRMELYDQAHALSENQNAGFKKPAVGQAFAKRSQQLLDQPPNDPGQLLSPYAHYQDAASGLDDMFIVD